MTKGKKLIYCKKCKRKRYCSKICIPNYNYQWTCSQGHTWIEIGITLNRINLIMEETLLPKMMELFNRDDTFYKELKNK